ncbi:peptide transporter family 1-like [Diorhabda sublineata]|uniref:peptide transporter family 1-like n=1 Tax=Diorhabda sublineata TaxID=1163346 RepID=UPI0024E154E0|nr:peptide transporter family 1-like [Diorhabda sublineata]
MYQESFNSVAILCIIATEFCERFAFSGLRTILSIYLRNVLLLSECTSTVIYHGFLMVCYIVPMAGAICADVYFGRYRTIRNFGIVYLIGHVLIFIAAVPIISIYPALFFFVGLTLIAIGTGGIKPCVAAFGAEQFNLPAQKDLLIHFFSVFYFTINLGGFVGMTLTPVLRKVSCFGDDTCYALAFGFPAALMILSMLLFVVGKNFYKLKSPKKKILVEFLKCGWYAVTFRFRTGTRSSHWLDVAEDKFNHQLVADMKIVSGILFLFVPLPIFWSLFDQQGSRWTFQASHMNGDILGPIDVAPDQMQVINPALVLIIIPILDRVFYPCFSRYNFLQNSLHRMAFGGLIAGVAFFSAGVLELVLETTYPRLPEKHQAAVNIINTLPCNLKVTNPFDDIQMVNAGHIIRFNNIVCYNHTSYKLYVEAPFFCGNLEIRRRRFEMNVVCFEYQIYSIFIGIDQQNGVQSFVIDPVDFNKSLNGYPRIRIIYIRNTNYLHNVTVSLKNQIGTQDMYFVPNSDRPSVAKSAYMELPHGVYECQISSTEEKILYEKLFHLALGGVYSLVIRENKEQIGFVKLFAMAVPNTVSILWQLPQYFLISVAEIMFGVAGLEFSFTQAPRSMKTVTIAGWYLSVAVGNLLVTVITQLNIFKSQANEFFLFAILIVADMMVFMEMASHYTFVTIKESSTTITTGCTVTDEIIPFIESIESDNSSE